MEQSVFRRALLALPVAIALASATPAQATENNAWAEAGLGVGSLLASLVYAPVKILYAAGGTLTAGGAWLFSAGNGSVMKPILDPSIRGDYVVTPSHLKGEDRLEFIGRPAEMRRLAADTTTSEYDSETLSGNDGF